MRHQSLTPRFQHTERLHIESGCDGLARQFRIYRSGSNGRFSPDRLLKLTPPHSGSLGALSRCLLPLVGNSHNSRGGSALSGEFLTQSPSASWNEGPSRMTTSSGSMEAIAFNAQQVAAEDEPAQLSVPQS
jgi:hypothetical protein